MDRERVLEENLLCDVARVFHSNRKVNRESEIHTQFCKWLEHKGFAYLHTRTDKRHTGSVGDPDFLVARDGRCIFIEIKVPGGKMSEAQIKRREELMDAGNIVELAYSLQDCIMAVEVLLK